MYVPCNNSSSCVCADGDGYCLPVYGLDNGTFYRIHIPALSCICVSFVCALATLSYSFYSQRITTFFTWTKNERFVVYVALCDALFNIAHFSDHLHIVLTESLPRPKSLCAFYGFMLAEFITAQNLMVNIVAINVFMMIFYRKKLNFGRWDHRLVLYIFGAPAVAAAIAGALGQLGPNGAFCYFDGVHGTKANIFFTTVVLVAILIINSILYILTWIRIHRETNQIRRSLGKSSQSIRLSHKAAKTMSFFVTAYFVQWWAMAMYGIWQVVEENPPQLLFNFVTTFSNIGGLLNGIVYIIILRRKTTNSEDKGKLPKNGTESWLNKTS